MLRWFGNVEQMCVYRMTKQIYEKRVNGEVDIGIDFMTFLDRGLFQSTCIKGLIFD